MTRFARAKGSKSSNEKLPEESTSWHVMKQQLQQKYEESSNSENVKEKEWKHSGLENDAWNSGSTTWADIENSENRVSKKLKDKKIKKQKIKLQVPDSAINAQKKQNTKIHKDLKFSIDKPHSVHSTDNTANLDVNQDDHEKPLNFERKNKHKKSKDVEHTGTSVFKRKIKDHKTSVEIDNSKNDTDELVVDTSVKKKKKKKLKKKQWPSDENSVKEENLAFEAEKFPDAESPEDLIQEVNIHDHFAKKEKKKGNYNLKKNNSNKGGKIQKPKNNNFSENARKRKLNDGQQNANFKRRKPDEQVQIFYLNGRSIEIVKFDGFPVKKEDAENLKLLKKSMIDKGIPGDEIKVTMKLERRKAEKALAREKKKNCFHCRMSGHVLSECPELQGKESHDSTVDGICFKCGSTEHTHSDCRVVKGQDFRFAKCFVCKEQGHISRQCPDNPKGLYPKGGACRECGDVTHLKKDCPTLLKTKEETTIRLQTLDSKPLEQLEEVQTSTSNENKSIKKKKVIKF